MAVTEDQTVTGMTVPERAARIRSLVSLIEDKHQAIDILRHAVAQIERRLRQDIDGRNAQERLDQANARIDALPEWLECQRGIDELRRDKADLEGELEEHRILVRYAIAERLGGQAGVL